MIPLALLGGAMVLPTVLVMMRIPMPEVSDEASRRRPAPVWAALAVAVAAAALQLAGQRLDWWALGCSSSRSSCWARAAAADAGRASCAWGVGCRASS